jgi:hypothetical protein
MVPGDGTSPLRLRAVVTSDLDWFLKGSPMSVRRFPLLPRTTSSLIIKRLNT